MCEFRLKGDLLDVCVGLSEPLRGLNQLQEYCNIIRITCVIYYILVGFKSWYRVP